MSRRISVLAAAAATALLSCLTGAGTATAAAAPAPFQPPCDTVFFPLNLGQGIEVFCDDAPGTYQVIAQCSDDSDIWTVPGTLAEAGAGPSVAECHGLLLFPAHVLSYFVVR